MAADLGVAVAVGSRPPPPRPRSRRSCTTGCYTPRSVQSRVTAATSPAARPLALDPSTPPRIHQDQRAARPPKRRQQPTPPPETTETRTPRHAASDPPHNSQIAPTKINLNLRPQNQRNRERPSLHGEEEPTPRGRSAELNERPTLPSFECIPVTVGLGLTTTGSSTQPRSSVVRGGPSQALLGLMISTASAPSLALNRPIDASNSVT
jgi:hypothetical protein